MTLKSSAGMPLCLHPRPQQPMPTSQVSAASDTEHTAHAQEILTTSACIASRVRGFSGQVTTADPGQPPGIARVLDTQSASDGPDGLSPARVSTDGCSSRADVDSSSSHTCDADVTNNTRDGVASCMAQPVQGIQGHEAHEEAEDCVSIDTASVAPGVHDQDPCDRHSQRTSRSLDQSSTTSVDSPNAPLALLQESVHPFAAKSSSTLLSNAAGQPGSSAEACVAAEVHVGSGPVSALTPSPYSTMSHNTAYNIQAAGTGLPSSTSLSVPSALSQWTNMTTHQPCEEGLTSAADFAPTSVSASSTPSASSNEKADIDHPFPLQEVQDCALAPTRSDQHTTAAHTDAATCSSRGYQGSAGIRAPAVQEAIHVGSIDSSIFPDDVQVLHQQGLPTATQATGNLPVQDSSVPDAAAAGTVLAAQPSDSPAQVLPSPRLVDDMRPLIDVQSLTPATSLAVWPGGGVEATEGLSGTDTTMVHSTHAMQCMTGIAASPQIQPPNNSSSHNATLSLMSFPERPVSSRGGTLVRRASGRSVQSSTHSSVHMHEPAGTASCAELGVTGSQEPSADSRTVFPRSTDAVMQISTAHSYQSGLSSADTSTAGGSACAPDINACHAQHEAVVDSMPMWHKYNVNVADSDGHAQGLHAAPLQAIRAEHGALGPQEGATLQELPSQALVQLLRDSPVAEYSLSEAACPSDPPSPGVTT